MEQNEQFESIVQEEDTLKGKYLVFFIDNELYGIEIRYITEIIGIQPITVVPETPPYIKGITDLRGKIIPVMDARLRLNKEERKYDERTCIIVLDFNGRSAGLIVDDVSEVMVINEENIAPPPEVNTSGRRFLEGIAKVDGKVILLFDLENTLLDNEASC